VIAACHSCSTCRHAVDLRVRAARRWRAAFVLRRRTGRPPCWHRGSSALAVQLDRPDLDLRVAVAFALCEQGGMVPASKPGTDYRES
jgi:hypothetical protein